MIRGEHSRTGLKAITNLGEEAALDKLVSRSLQICSPNLRADDQTGKCHDLGFGKKLFPFSPNFTQWSRRVVWTLRS